MLLQAIRKGDRCAEIPTVVNLKFCSIERIVFFSHCFQPPPAASATAKRGEVDCVPFGR